jgi:hypothetical protein
MTPVFDSIVNPDGEAEYCPPVIVFVPASVGVPDVVNALQYVPLEYDKLDNVGCAVALVVEEAALAPTQPFELV